MGRTIINHPPVITINRWYVYQCLPFPNGWFIIVLPTLFFLEGGGAAKLCDNQLLENSDTKPSQCHTRSSRCPRTLELKLPIPAISSRCCPRSGCAWAVGFTCSRLVDVVDSVESSLWMSFACFGPWDTCSCICMYMYIYIYYVLLCCSYV